MSREEQEKTRYDEIIQDKTKTQTLRKEELKRALQEKRFTNKRHGKGFDKKS